MIFFSGKGGLGYRNEKGHYSIDNQTLKNVCSKCNNEVFSRYDNKMVNFLKINFHNDLIFKGNIIDFKYDFYDLTRWILKTLYNSYEKNGYKMEKNINFIHKYKDYILGKTNDINFKCFVEVLRDPYLMEDINFTIFQMKQEKNIKRELELLNHLIYCQN